MSERIIAALAAAPARGQLVRHTDGGIYRFVGLSQSTEDQSLSHLYDHVWPFEPTLVPWARPSEQWGTRFVAITEADLAEAMKQNRAQAQQAVTEAKAARRAAQTVMPALDYDNVPLLPILDRHTGLPLKGFESAGEAPHAERADAPELLSPEDVPTDFHLIRASQEASDLTLRERDMRFVTRTGAPMELNPFKTFADFDVVVAKSGAGASKTTE
jgi:hypothetical protein